METVFERASRRAAERTRAALWDTTPRYQDVLVVAGARTLNDAMADVGSMRRVAEADLVIGVKWDLDAEATGVVLKDLYARERRTVTESMPCPCQSGRRFGVCHGR